MTRVLLRDPQAALSELQRKTAMNPLIAALQPRGTPVCPPRADRDRGSGNLGRESRFDPHAGL